MTLEDSLGLGVFALVVAVFAYYSSQSQKKSGRPRSSGVPVASAELATLMHRFPPLTIVLIAVSVAVSFYSNFGDAVARLFPLFIAEPGSAGFESVMSGQFWRLLTPIFIHFGFMHIIFNMMWMWDLGGLIERVKGVPVFVGFVVGVGIAANVAQYAIAGSPFFGGMSGVVYGLLGYVWISGKRNPQYGFGLHQQTAVMMFGWYVLCWTGLLGPVANWAHTAGLVLGIAIGYPRLARSR